MKHVIVDYIIRSRSEFFCVEPNDWQLTIGRSTRRPSVPNDILYFIFKRVRLIVFDKNSCLRFLVDTGADVSLLPRYRFKNLGRPTTYTLHTANGSTIRTYGTRMLKLYLGLRRDLSFTFILAVVTKAIVGADFLAHFGIIFDLKRAKLKDGSQNSK